MGMERREPTLGEIDDRLREMGSAIVELTRTIERTYVRQDVWTVEKLTMQRDVDELKEKLSTATRAAFTSLVLPILVAIVMFILTTRGGAT